MQAEHPIKVQAIRTKGQKPRLYVYVPMALAAAIGLESGEQVQWTLLDRNTLQVKRYRPVPVTTARVPGKRKAGKASE
jgi:hypothetical protein